jgi:ABC-2 type transport system ATP-binding protein
MKQKVKLATALVHDPPLLFLDEPTNGLDPGGRREMLELIGDLVTAKGKSVILSSHILGDVERVCRNAVLIEKGQLRAAGTLEELTRFAERIYQLRVSGDPTGVERLLAGRGYRVNRSGDDGDMEVAVPEGEGPEGIFEEVARGGSHVRKLAAKRRTLEEVFVSAVGEA